ncbi:MAG: orotidine-5'-phosphate decarboxylase [Rhodobacterales bacterium]|nr:orotidine-5'-phosphate decarboxylase [Rhodobacterales bacterium]
MTPTDRIFAALDTTDLDRALALAGMLAGKVGGMKVGKEFFTAQGPQGTRRIVDLGMPLFMDLKWHDIPNTVASAVRAALPLGPRFVNVHASGGPAMLRAAAEAAAEGGDTRPKVLGVTVLTSMDADDLRAVGVESPPAEQVLRLARLSQDCGLDGVVCSAHEIAALRAACGPDFVLMVPGIRPAWSATGDQKRVMTPADAIAAGADHLVIGRPITAADDPAAAADRIARELEGL